ncbi:hypothetical protein CTI16_02245 [Prevotella intermedia]|uniref:Uncharacterized protein n=1 Tax=Prevotella intermedia TaxID=28131 RepID=A0AAJ3V9D0_PREIN|nr:hypothetical protein CTM61_06945 [Prevotella intermedia]PIK17997.1 hypothetical protein CTI16_02245 [Prevotella intermedia]
MALRKRLFCNAKEPLLPCKTYAFGTQNNRFCNALIISKLNNSYACKKCLQIYYPVFVCESSYPHLFFIVPQYTLYERYRVVALRQNNKRH